MAVLLDRIPLIDDDHAGAALFFDAAGQPLILLGDAIKGIDHQHADIGPLDRLETAGDAEVFGAVVDAAAAADAGGVQQLPGATLPFEGGVDGVAGGAADGTDDGPVLAADRIQQAGFTHVGAADDRQLDRFFAFVFTNDGQEGEGLIEHLTGAGAMDGGDGVGFAQPQAPEFGRHRQPPFRGLAFVHRHQHGHGLMPQPLTDGGIGGGEALLAVHHKNCHHGFGQGQSRLLADFRQKFAVIVKDEAAGVDDAEGAIPPEAFLVSAVAGDPGLVMHDGFPAATQPVDQGGLAHVGAPKDGDDRKRQ